MHSNAGLPASAARGSSSVTADASGLTCRLCAAKGYVRLVGPAVNALLSPPRLPATDVAALVPPNYIARRAERDHLPSGSDDGDGDDDAGGAGGLVRGHVTLMNRAELSQALARGQSVGALLAHLQRAATSGATSSSGVATTARPSGGNRSLCLPPPALLGLGRAVSPSTRSEAFFAALCWPEGQAARLAVKKS